MIKKSGVISYRNCSLLVAVVFYLQFLVSFCVKRLWSVLGMGAPDGFVYIIVTQLFAVGLPCAIFALVEKADFKREFSFKKIGIKEALYGVVLGISIQPVAMLINIPLQMLVINLKGELPVGVANSPQNGWQIFAMLFVVCLVPAVFEELLLRGMLMSSVKKYGLLKAVVVTTVVFALLHNDVSSLAGLLLLGAVLGFSVLMTGSVMTGMIIHFFFNGTAVFIDYFLNKYHQLNSLGFLGLMASVGALVAVFAIFGLYNKNQAEFMKHNCVGKGWGMFFNFQIILLIVGFVFGGLL